MSRPAEAERDAGFSLVEVVVAIGIVMTLLVAVLPQMIGGIRANDIARSNTQAKTLVSSELERMRNLPFQVQPNAGQYVDLFDRYFQDTTAPTTQIASAPTCRSGGRWVPPAPSSSGYVSTSARCPYEPPTGAFYRVVRTTAGLPSKGISPDPDLTGFVLVIATQFLDAATPPLPRTPQADYNTKTVGKDTPVTGQVGITVTVLPDRPTSQRPVTSYTQISRTYQTTTRVRATSDSVALEAGTMLPGPTSAEGNRLSVSGGLVHLDSSLVAASRVEVSAAGTTASAATGENDGTMRTSQTAPPDSAVTWSDTGSGQLTTAGCDLVCWGGGATSGTWTPTTANGLPGIGSPSNPLEVALKTPSAGGGYALRMGSGQGALFRPALGLSNPILRLRSSDFTFGISDTCTVTDAGSGLRLSGGGWAQTTASGADACSTARTAEVAVLPKDGDGNPLVKIRLRAASARCRVTSGTPSTAVDFLVDVSYWDGGTYRPVGTYTEEGTSDLPDPSTLSVGGLPLSTWIDSWSVARVGHGINRVAAGRVARAEIPAVVSILTQPLRNQANADGTVRLDADGDPIQDGLSTMAVTVGSVSCSAEDRR